MNTTFESLGLSEPLLRALSAENYTQPTPIQLRAIPALLAGRDLLGIAQTGTGKTAAFGLPLLQHLSQNQSRAQHKATRALILAPTRELAVQIEQSLKTYGRHLNLRSTVILGGVSQNTQINAMKNGVDILVATPGRLLDLVNQRQVRLDSVRYLIVDEADRMLDMGFIKDVRRIVAMLPKERQSMLFSATMPDDVVKLVGDMLRTPERIEVSPPTRTADRIDQHVIHIEQRNKRALLTHLLKDDAMKRVIVFTRTKHVANRVSDHLEKSGFAADAIHGNKSQNARQRALDGFKSGSVRVLVATDIAARGVDVDNVTHVINFELPNDAESYVHRIGRTARAGTEGIAISFCDPNEKTQLRDIERLVRKPLPVMTHDVPPEAFVQAAANENRGEHRRPNPARPPQAPGERNYRRPKRRWHPRGNSRAA
ncbi:MAG: DEAD/DEAH box helicase [Alphaproteobacteria bacterium]|nr:DEAD/DEAH box helicase [Alphaproteobacteria bacterium]MBV9540449.1 DEAD/DEAH box helicase [Alphaproteobacteria bacterium]